MTTGPVTLSEGSAAPPPAAPGSAVAAARRARVALALLAGALLAAELTGPATGDEMLPFVAAERLLAGGAPHLDYKTHYGPLVPVLEAVALSVGPRMLLTTRLAFLVVVVAGWVAAWRGSVAAAGDERRGTWTTCLALPLLCPVDWGVSLGAAASLVLAGAACLAASPGRGRPRLAAVLGGVLLGLAVTARHDLGGVGAAAVLAHAWTWARRPLLAAAVLGAAAPPAAVLTWLGARGALGAAYDDLFGTLAADYVAGRRLALPAPWALLAGYPAVCLLYAPVVLGALALGRAAADARARPAEARAAAAAGGLALLLTASAWVRCDRSHFAPAMLAALPALAALARGARTPARVAALALGVGTVAPVAAGVVGAQVRTALEGRARDPRPLYLGLADSPLRSPDRSRPPVVVRVRVAVPDEPNESAWVHPRGPLDAYLEHWYDPFAVYGPYLLLARRAAAR